MCRKLLLNALLDCFHPINNNGTGFGQNADIYVQIQYIE